MYNKKPPTTSSNKHTVHVHEEGKLVDDINCVYNAWV